MEADNAAGDLAVIVAVRRQVCRAFFLGNGWLFTATLVFMLGISIEVFCLRRGAIVLA